MDYTRTVVGSLLAMEQGGHSQGGASGPRHCNADAQSCRERDETQKQKRHPLQSGARVASPGPPSHAIAVPSETLFACGAPL